MAYFPMFVDIKGKSCVVIGGGKIALHKVTILLEFGADVTVVAPSILPDIQSLKDVQCEQRGYRPSDLEQAQLVVAATDEKALNHRVSVECQKRRIPVNAVDQVEDCTFIFPSYVKQSNVVAAFSSGGNSPVLTQYLKEREKEILTPQLGELGEQLGRVRTLVKELVVNAEDRREIFADLLQYGFACEQVPEEEEFGRIVQKLCAEKLLNYQT